MAAMLPAIALPVVLETGYAVKLVVVALRSVANRARLLPLSALVVRHYPERPDWRRQEVLPLYPEPSKYRLIS